MRVGRNMGADRTQQQGLHLALASTTDHQGVCVLTQLDERGSRMAVEDDTVDRHVGGLLPHH